MLSRVVPPAPLWIFIVWVVALLSWWPDFDPKWVRLAPNGTNPGLFQIRFQYILARRAKMYWNLIWKSPGFVPFGANLTHFGSKSGQLLSPSYAGRAGELASRGRSLDEDFYRFLRLLFYVLVVLSSKTWKDIVFHMAFIRGKPYSCPHTIVPLSSCFLRVLLVVNFWSFVISFLEEWSVKVSEVLVNVFTQMRTLIADLRGVIMISLMIFNIYKKCVWK